MQHSFSQEPIVESLIAQEAIESLVRAEPNCTSVKQESCPAMAKLLA
jgi:hypothetical protein